MSTDLPPEGHTRGDPWHHAVAIILVILIDHLAHDDERLTGTSRHQSLDHLLEAALSDVVWQFRLDSPYAVEVQSHITDILDLYLAYRRRLPPD